MLIGLEKELFIWDKNNKLTVCPKKLPHDECGILAEARGEARHDIAEAVFSLEADCFRLTSKANKLDLQLDDTPLHKVSRDLRLKANRIYAKGLTNYQNLYEFKRHRNNQNEQTAGIHISFTNPHDITNENKQKITVNELFDFVQLFKHFDRVFAQEIKQAKRNPGFYEIKPDLRIEYRSLPSNVILTKIIEAYLDFIKNDYDD